MKAQKGFTLIELMIVIAIIGILASVAMPMYRDYVTKTRVAAVLATVSNLQKALTITNNEGGTATANKWTEIGMRGAPASDDIKSVAFSDLNSPAVDGTDGVIIITLNGKVDGSTADDSEITLTPSFGGATTTWTSSYTGGTGVTTAVAEIITKYLKDNVNGS